MSNGKYTIPHFEAKNKIDRYIKSNAALHAKTTFLWVTFYASNYCYPMYTPYYIPSAGKYIQIQSTSADALLFSIVDVRANFGPVVEAILAQPNTTRQGTFVHVFTDKITAGDMLQAWAAAQNTNALHVRVDKDVYNVMWPGWSEEMGVMMEFWESAGENGWSGEDRIITLEELGVKGLVDIKQFFLALKF